MFNVSLSNLFSKEDLRFMVSVTDEYHGTDPETGISTERRGATEQGPQAVYTRHQPKRKRATRNV